MWRSTLLVLLVLATYLGMVLAIADPTTRTEYPPVDIGSPSTIDAPATVVVAPGDHLWKIAETRLAEVKQNPTTDSEVAPYWRNVISANTGSLRSGDPDLIYPGELVRLPEVANELP